MKTPKWTCLSVLLITGACFTASIASPPSPPPVGPPEKAKACIDQVSMNGKTVACAFEITGQPLEKQPAYVITGLLTRGLPADAPNNLKTFYSMNRLGSSPGSGQREMTKELIDASRFANEPPMDRKTFHVATLADGRLLAIPTADKSPAARAADPASVPRKTLLQITN